MSCVMIGLTAYDEGAASVPRGIYPSLAVTERNAD